MVFTIGIWFTGVLFCRCPFPQNMCKFLIGFIYRFIGLAVQVTSGTHRVQGKGRGKVSIDEV